ncbi:MAG: DUF2631 domain-containing protein [Mycobacteriales bacterium]
MTHSDGSHEVTHVKGAQEGDPVEVQGEPDRPEDWGWHAEAGKGARIGAVVIAAILLVMLVGNDIGNIAKIWLICLAAGLLLILVLDRNRRKNSWRNK